MMANFASIMLPRATTSKAVDPQTSVTKSSRIVSSTGQDQIVGSNQCTGRCPCLVISDRDEASIGCPPKPKATGIVLAVGEQVLHAQLGHDGW